MNYKKNYYIFFIFLSVVLCGCTGNNISQITAYYTGDLTLNVGRADYFIPESTYYKYVNTLKNFNPNTEYHKDILKDLSAKKIKSQIREVCSIHFSSDLLSIYIQFPNRKTFNKFVNILKTNPYISKKDFEKLLQYEYSFSVNSTGFGWNSDNYISLYENSAYKGEPYHHLSDENVRYFFSDNFKNNMDVISAWINEKKWNDPNYTMELVDGIYRIRTIDESE